MLVYTTGVCMRACVFCFFYAYRQEAPHRDTYSGGVMTVNTLLELVFTLGCCQTRVQYSPAPK